MDGVRTVGFFLVFAYHTWVYGGSPDLGLLSAIAAQNTRPDFFVVVTGFVLFLPLVRRPGHVATLDTRRYVLRRLRRIVVPYWAALAFAILLPQLLVVATRLVGLPSTVRSWPTWPDLLSHLSFTHLFFTDYWASINGSLWTMSLEMQLYLVFPLLVLAWHRWGWPALGVALVAWAAYRVAVLVWVPDTGFPSRFLWEAQAPGRLVELLAGMVSAVLVARWLGRTDRWHTAAYLAAAIAAYVVAVAPFLSGSPLREAGLGVAFGALIVSIVGSHRGRVVFGSRAMAGVGVMSYSLFLIHEPVAWYLSEALRRGAGMADGAQRVWVLWTVGLAVTVAVGWVFYRLVEKPCLAWARQIPSPTRTDPGSGDRAGG
ncbi:MAG: acyltransferase [Actinomycetales bacterium]|nr:acyltransferase [Candidatus Phosphoribacter baldrii]